MQNVVRASAKTSLGSDPTVYPVEEKVGEDMLQRWIAELLRPLLERWLRHSGRPTFVGADQFIYYQAHTPTLRVSPDVYVLPGVAPETRVLIATGAALPAGAGIRNATSNRTVGEQPGRRASAPSADNMRVSLAPIGFAS